MGEAIEERSSLCPFCQSSAYESDWSIGYIFRRYVKYLDCPECGVFLRHYEEDHWRLLFPQKTGNTSGTGGLAG